MPREEANRAKIIVNVLEKLRNRYQGEGFLGQI